MPEKGTPHQDIEEGLATMFHVFATRGMLVGIVFFLTFGAVDYIITPENFRAFVEYRIAASLVLLAVYFLLKRHRGDRLQYLLGHVAIFSSAVALEMMILRFGGHASPYYVGMIILMACATGFVPASLSFHGVNVILIYATYLVPIVLFDTIKDQRLFFTHNCFFVIVITAQLIVGNMTHKWVRQLLTEFAERGRVEARLRNYQGQLQSLMQEMSLIEERERRQIAESLHDNIGQNLALSKLNLLSLLETGGPGCERLDRTAALIDQAISYTRSLTFELSPPILYELGFKAAVEWLTEYFSQQYSIDIELISYDVSHPIDNEKSILLFKAIRELLLNVVKHSKAKRAELFCLTRERNIVLTIKDYGIGLDTLTVRQDMGRARSFGLFSVSERVHYLGGSFEIESEPGRGTVVTVSIPLERCAQGDEQ